MDGTPSLTGLLQQFSATKDREVADSLLREAYPQLRQIATRALGCERRYVPLTPTELIDEAWLTRLHQGRWQIRDRGDFFAIAAKVMRLVLVDLARKRLAKKRISGEASVPLDLWSDVKADNTATPEQIVAIDEILELLAKSDPEASSVFELKYFAGFTLEEIADIQRMRLRQIRYRWDKANDWLKKRLGF